MDQPLVSIILPVYNAQNHLARCIGSILNQTYKNIELIILNDGSKDHSLPVCEEFRAKDSRIVLVDKENSGVSDTRNLGLKLAGGEYVQFVDSDDYIDPDFTQHLVEAAETHHADLVIAPYKMVIPAGATKPEQVLEKLEDNLGVMSVARPPEVREYGFLPAGVYDKDTFALRLMDKPASYFYSVLWNKLYRRILLTGNDIQFTSELKWAEDLVFNMQYIQYAETFVSIDKAGYYYVQNPQSICHTQINRPPSCRTRSRRSGIIKTSTPALGCTRRCGPSCISSWWISPRAPTPPAPSKRSLRKPRNIGKTGKNKPKSGDPLRGLPFLWLCSDGSALLCQPIPLFFIQAGSQLLKHFAVVGVQPVQLVPGQDTGHHRRGGNGHKGQRTEGQEGAVLVVGLVVALQHILNADTHLTGFVHARLIGDDHARLEHRGVAAVQGVGASWTLPTKLTLWPVPQR